MWAAAGDRTEAGASVLLGAGTNASVFADAVTGCT